VQFFDAAQLELCLSSTINHNAIYLDMGYCVTSFVHQDRPPNVIKNISGVAHNNKWADEMRFTVFYHYKWIVPNQYTSEAK
jgi:hypothetical protein